MLGGHRPHAADRRNPVLILSIGGTMPDIKHDQDLDKDWCPACRLGRALKGEE